MKKIAWEIILKKIEGRISSEEEAILNHWLNDSAEHQEYYKMAKEYHEKDVENLDLEKVPSTTKLFLEKLRKKSPPVFFLKRLRHAVAILLPALILLSVWFYHVENQSKELTTNIPPDKIEPISNKARLITSTGEVVSLEDERTQQINDLSGVTISNDSMVGLKYHGSVEKTNTMDVYNTLITPTGGEYKLELADGTQVWLNCDSELKYPVAFDGDTRLVFLRGEAFFDVSKREEPFIVQVQDLNIEVLGTRFNISAYPDDNSFQTTLTKGSLKVIRTDSMSIGRSVVLQPGQQANFDKSLRELQQLDVDTILYTGWIDGYFRFQNKPLDEVMKNIARWYDIEVVYDGDINRSKRLSGRLYRMDDYTVITSMIGRIAGTKIDTEGKQVTISK